MGTFKTSLIAILACVAAVALTGCDSGNKQSDQKIVQTSQGTTPDNEPDAPAQVAQTAVVEPEPEPEPDPDEGKTWQQIAKEGDGAVLENQKDHALERFEKALEMLGTDLATDAPEAATLRLQLGRVYLYNNQSEYAIAHYTQAFSILEHRYGPLDERVLPALRHLTAYRDWTGEPEISDVFARRYERIVTRGAREAISTRDEAAHPDVRKSELAGDAHLAKRQYEDAGVAYSEAIEMAREKHGSESIVVANLLIKSARLGGNGAVDSWREALANLTLRYGPLDTRLRPVLNSLVAYHDEQGEYDKAELYIKRLEMINRKASATSTPK